MVTTAEDAWQPLPYDPATLSQVRVLHNYPVTLNRVRVLHYDPATQSQVTVLHNDPVTLSLMRVNPLFIQYCGRLAAY